jgi:hypothetical protein
MNRRQRRAFKKKSDMNDYKQFMRTQLIHNACESLTAEEVKEAMVKGYELKYISTQLDENGVPIEGETKSIKISNIDILRLRPIYDSKLKQESINKE